MQNNDDLFSHPDIKERVATVWDKVFGASNQVLLHLRKYGFLGMEVMPNPNIHQLLGALQLLNVVLESLMSFDDLDYDQKRLIINSREQLLRLERVATALKENNESDFNEAITLLEAQAVF